LALFAGGIFYFQKRQYMKITISFKIIYFLVLLFFADCRYLLAQKSNSEKMISQAEKKINKQKYADAIEILNEALKSDSLNAKGWYLLADSYFKIRDYVEAKNYFQKAYSINERVVPQAAFYYALMLKMNGDYLNAKKIFESFLNTYKAGDQYINWTKTEIAGCEKALNRKEYDTDETLQIYHLPEGINSKYSEMGPIFWDDSTLMYASLPADTIILITGKEQLDYNIKFYLADFKNDSFYNPLKVDDFNVPNSSLVSGCLSADRKTFYFGSCNDWEFGTLFCQIFESKYQNGQWYDPERLGSPLNDFRYNNNHPAIGFLPKGKQVLYFSSDRPGGKGGKDIWYSIIDVSGKFSPPVNAGKINTSRDEITPFYDNINGVLYFSSDGHVGYGGLDVYRATGERNIWSEIENLNLPVN
jgi:OmpA-OmpF porin, OOP family